MKVEIFVHPSPIESLIKSIVAQANAINHMLGDRNEDALYSDVDTLCKLGPEARIRALFAIREIRDLVARTSIAFRLLMGSPLQPESGIYFEALDALSRSSTLEDQFLLLQITLRIAEHVDRVSLRRGLVRAWRGASGRAKYEFDLELRKRGFRRILGVWI